MSAIRGTAADEPGVIPAVLHDDRVPLAAWAIGVCTGPSAPWKTLWPRMKHYD